MAEPIIGAGKELEDRLICSVIEYYKARGIEIKPRLKVHITPDGSFLIVKVDMTLVQDAYPVSIIRQYPSESYEDAVEEYLLSELERRQFELSLWNTFQIFKQPAQILAQINFIN